MLMQITVNFTPILQLQTQVVSTTYSLSMPFKNGNNVSNWSRCVRPCTIATGIKNRTVRVEYATKTTSLPIHFLRNETVKKGQWTSCGSGASSVIHSVGLTPSWICNAIAAPNRVLNETNAAGTSYKFKFITIQSGELDIIINNNITIQKLYLL